MRLLYYAPIGFSTLHELLAHVSSFGEVLTIYFIFTGMQWDAMFKTGNFELSRSTEILEGWYCESSVARFAINPSRSR